jgi:twitching motility protein PilT
MALDLKKLLSDMLQLNASDLHLKTGTVPIYRVNGELMPAEHPPVSREELNALLDKIIPPSLKQHYSDHGSVDFAFSIDPVNRFRTNAYRQRGAVSVAMRRLAYDVLSFEKLGLPKVLETIAGYRRGLILCVGPTGTGKSTTMATLIDYINSSRKEHIITIEDPIEFLYRDKMSVIEQREIGIDCPTFEEGLRNALRQDPNVILVGEMRDRETITIGMQAAMTGHLVISTLHTTSAVHTVNRILQFYKIEEQGPMREQLAGALRAVISQRLIRTTDGTARIPCVEVLVVNNIVQKLLRENRIDDIETVIRNGADGMQSFDRSLADMVRAQKITEQVGESYAEDIPGFKRLVRGVKAGTDQSSILGGF